MSSESPQRPDVYYGGQAVIEGVMIRAPAHMAVAVRHPSGEIVRHVEALQGLYTGRVRRIPLVRGAVVLWETLALGMRALTFSSRIALEEEDNEGEAVEFPEAVMWGSMALAMLFAVGIFFVGPVLLANFLESQGLERALVVVIEAVLRLGLLVGYLALISLMPDIRRVFQYHGAEHMTIHAYEAGRPLTVAEVRTRPKEHTRCGTSFLLVVVAIALVTLLAFDLLVDEGIMVRVASRVLLLPPIAGVSYEVLRFGARFGSNRLVQALFAPNIALQALTTRVPADDQIEVAIAAFETALESATGGEAGA